MHHFIAIHMMYIHMMYIHSYSMLKVGQIDISTEVMACLLHGYFKYCISTCVAVMHATDQ